MAGVQHGSYPLVTKVLGSLRQIRIRQIRIKAQRMTDQAELSDREELARLQIEDRQMRATLSIDEDANLPARVWHLVQFVQKVDAIFTDSATVQRIINKETDR